MSVPPSTGEQTLRDRRKRSGRSALAPTVHAVEEPEVRTALHRVGLDPVSIRAIPGGWANFTYDVDHEFIVRFPRTDAVAIATQHELQLLPDLAPRLSFAIPVPTHVSTWRDRPFFAYRRIDGVAVGPDDIPDCLAATMASILRELHAYPVERAAKLLNLGAAERAWEHRYEDLWSRISEIALPEMELDLAETVKRRYAAMLDDPPDFPVTFVHNDLGLEHVLVGERSREPVALIDFEDATVGDPAVDFVPLVAAIGRHALPELTADRDLGERLQDRLHFYRWMGSIHAIIYGITAGREYERAAGLTELRRRIGAD
jgi:aminoglycoside phosphotransferase (APT) family kinase protein